MFYTDIYKLITSWKVRGNFNSVDSFDDCLPASSTHDQDPHGKIKFWWLTASYAALRCFLCVYLCFLVSKKSSWRKNWSWLWGLVLLLNCKSSSCCNKSCTAILWDCHVRHFSMDSMYCLRTQGRIQAQYTGVTVFHWQMYQGKFLHLRVTMVTK